MKLVTKMRKFVERMENVESMSERQLVEMLFKAEKMMAEYIATEERKEAAYIALKEATNYRARKTTEKVSQDVSQETLEESVEEVEENVMEEVAVSIQLNATQEEEQILDNGGYIEMNENVLQRLNIPGLNIAQKVLEQGRLVITKESEEKGLLIGAYHKDGAITYFSSSNSYDNPVVFGNPALTTEIKEAILAQRPSFYKSVTKNFKSIALFGKSNNQAAAMVYLIDAKRLVFEGYVGDMVFSTSKSYLDADYSPLVTRADIFIRNGGKHNHVADNMCTPSLKEFIVSLIEQYMASPKFSKACNDVEYFSRLRSSRKQQAQVVVEPKPQTQVQNLGYGLNDIYTAMQAEQSAGVAIGGGIDYEPEF